MSPVFDSYVRLTQAAFERLQLVHMQSGIDSDEDRVELKASGAAGRLQSISGYTEWVTESAPTVSVGWDWVLATSGNPTLIPHTVRTNVMLIDEKGSDSGYQATSDAVTQALNHLPWEAAVLATVQAPPP